MMKNLVLPIESKKRLVEIDILRGIALFGVLLINIFMFAAPPNHHIGEYYPISKTDTLLFWAINILVQGKFYTLFSLLFGFGFAMQMHRFKQKLNTPKRFFARRMLVLFFIGLLHSILIWSGDILRFYALIGFIMILFRNWKPKKQLLLGMIILGIFITLYTLLAFAEGSPIPLTSEQISRLNLQQFKHLNFINIPEAYKNGSFLDAISYRTHILFSGRMILFLIVALLNILPVFLIGSYLGNKFMSLSPEKIYRSLKKIFIATILLSLPLIAAYLFIGIKLFQTTRSLASPWILLIENMLNITLCLTYISSILLLLRSKKVMNILTPLSFVGKASLSNYLLQAIVFTLISYGYGLSQVGSYRISELVFAALVFYILQIIFSMIWFRYFSFGPFEWLWRTLTYNKRISIRKK